MIIIIILTEEQEAILFRTNEVLMSSTREALSSLKACDKRIVQTEKMSTMQFSKLQLPTSQIVLTCIYDVELVVSERLGKGKVRQN